MASKRPAVLGSSPATIRRALAAMAMCGVQSPLALARRSPILLQVPCGAGLGWSFHLCSTDQPAYSGAADTLLVVAMLLVVLLCTCNLPATPSNPPPALPSPPPSNPPVLPRQRVAGDRPPRAAALPRPERSRGGGLGLPLGCCRLRMPLLLPPAAADDCSSPCIACHASGSPLGGWSWSQHHAAAVYPAAQPSGASLEAAQPQLPPCPSFFPPTTSYVFAGVPHLPLLPAARAPHTGLPPAISGRPRPPAAAGAQPCRRAASVAAAGGS